MTTQDKKEAVRQAIIRAVPSVMDLVFGCEVISYGRKFTIIRTNYSKKASEENDSFLVSTLHYQKGWSAPIHMSVRMFDEIIGRPITFADVLVAIGNMLVIVDCMGNFYQMEMKLSDKLPKLGKHLGKYDLSQDFDHQSDEVYSFLYELLCE